MSRVRRVNFTSSSSACIPSFVRHRANSNALKHNDITIEKDPKRLLVTVRNGKTGYRVANTMAGAVSAYERIKARYPDAGGEDYLVLPDYPNRATASRIFQRQFNQLLDETGLKHNPVTETKRSVYCLRHTRDLHEDHSLTRQGQHLQPRQERRHQRRADRALLCQASAALARDGEEPAEFRGGVTQSRLLLRRRQGHPRPNQTSSSKRLAQDG